MHFVKQRLTNFPVNLMEIFVKHQNTLITYRCLVTVGFISSIVTVCLIEHLIYSQVKTLIFGPI